MPVHDWTRVEAGIFHAFHVAWIPKIQETLNAGLLPQGFYALAEQHAGRAIADVLTLHSDSALQESLPASLPDRGGTAVAESPPKARRRQTVDPTLARRRTLAIRHVSGHRLIAIIEILSPANKDRPRTLEEFADKAVGALRAGVHLLLVDLFPPGPHDPHGIHDVVRERLEDAHEPYDLPALEPLTLASYVAGPLIDIYINHVALGAVLPDMPLFLHEDRYVNVPLESTYIAAYRGMPAYWRDVLEGRQSLPQ